MRKLHAFGYIVIAIEGRNHGNSSTLGGRTFTEDILAAVDFLAAKNPSMTLGVIGLSIGGGAVIAAAGQDERIQAAITVGAISHPIDLMKAHFAERHIPGFLVSSLFVYMRLRFGIDYERIAPINHIPNAEGKILLIHGEDDETVPLAHGRKLAAANPTSARLWVAPAKGHSDCHLHPEFWARLDQFLTENLG